MACDPNSPESARALVTETVDHFGRVDILVANHGVWPPEDVPIEQMTDKQWGSTMSINLDAVFGLVKHGVAASENTTSHPSGRRTPVVLISSTSGSAAKRFICDYSATKGALISMTKGLSTESLGHADSAVCVSPPRPQWVAQYPGALIWAAP